MRYVIFGAGAIGGTIGARLFDGGHDVGLIARGPHLEKIRESGLRLQRPDADQTYRIEAYGSPDEAEIGEDDVVVMAMKSQHMPGALKALSATAHNGIPVICAQNGVENERSALRLFPRVYAMCVMLPSEHMEAGTVRAYGAPRSGILDLGRYPYGIDDVAQAVASDLDGCGFSSRAVEKPMMIKYGKLLRNLYNGIEALGGDEALGTDLAARARAEGHAVLKVAGIEALSAEADEERRSGLLTRKAIGNSPRAGRSSWQSLARGTGSIESDYINGEIVLLGRLHQVPTPVNAAIQLLGRRAALEGLAPGSFSAAELLEAADRLEAS